MAPLSLLDCPSEVLVSIAQLLPKPDLANLCMACQALHNLAEPLVYSDVRIMWDRRYYAPITKILRLLRTLLDRPALCNIIRSLKFEGYRFIDYDSPPWPGETPEPPEIPLLPMEKLTAAITRMSLSQSFADCWMREILYSESEHLDLGKGRSLNAIRQVQTASSQAGAAMLVSLLPNLEHLCLSAHWTTNTRYLGWVIRDALHNPDSHLRNFNSLKYVSLVETSDEEHRLKPENTADALAFFYLPNIETLSISIDNPTNFSWPFSSPPNPASLKSLEIFRLRETHLAPILSVTKNLKELQYHWYYRSDLDEEVSTDIVMLDIMAEAFLKVSSSLEGLHITSLTHPAFSRGDYDPPDVSFQGSLARLRGMTKLRTLHVPWVFLARRDDFSTTGGIGRATPNNLEHLALDDYVLSEEEEEEEDDDGLDKVMISAFERELESGSLSHAKSLKSVCLPESSYAGGFSDYCRKRVKLLEARFGLVLSFSE
ncbi:hypothetical protein F53441_234 [Fusarium austroafricanum]|uniref:F-box domain-containing protein n=1 Tax=Fusarium austroafricanum TaxID=2364996 RepID=A0A8H4KW76_9HYPO|nr:hypothetical protein F53441_234 [Fusarium austroafricanum]